MPPNDEFGGEGYKDSSEQFQEKAQKFLEKQIERMEKEEAKQGECCAAGDPVAVGYAMPAAFNILARKIENGWVVRYYIHREIEVYAKDKSELAIAVIEAVEAIEKASAKA